MKCMYKENYNVLHTKKRKFIGAEKDKVLSSIINDEVCPSVYTRNEANKIMKEGTLMFTYYLLI